MAFPGRRFARADGVSIADTLMSVFADLGQLRFTRNAFAKAVHRHLPSVEDELLDVLWHHRVIGYTRPGDLGDEEVFFSAGERESIRFPASSKEIVIHRALIDTVQLAWEETASSRLRPIEWEEPVAAEEAESAGVRTRRVARPGASRVGDAKSKEQAGTSHPRSREAAEALVFISHASEDRCNVAEPLARALEKRGWHAWFDKYELRVGDSLVGRIDSALAQARFGVLILSPAFFAKNWPLAEMNALVARELAENALGMVLPVWHRVSRDEVARYSPLLAGRLAVSTKAGIDVVADAVVAAMESDPYDRASETSRAALISGVPPPGREDRQGPPSLDQLNLLEELKRLLPVVFEEVVFRLGVPPSHLSNGPQSARAIDLIRYVGDARMTELESAIRSARS